MPYLVARKMVDLAADLVAVDKFRFVVIQDKDSLALMVSLDVV